MARSHETLGDGKLIAPTQGKGSVHYSCVRDYSVLTLAHRVSGPGSHTLCPSPSRTWGHGSSLSGF
jgi:hypothetical protein